MMSDDTQNGFGHNSGDTSEGETEVGVLTEDRRRALLFHHMGHVKKQKAKLATATSDLRNIFKRAKADGLSKRELDFALLLDGDDDEALLAERRRELEIARWMNHPIGTQFSLLDEPDRTPLDERAYEGGKVAGMKGEPAKSPHQGAAEQEWLRGYAEGQEVLMGTLKLTKAGLTQIKKERKAKANGGKKRGRKPKAQDPRYADVDDPFSDAGLGEAQA